MTGTLAPPRQLLGLFSVTELVSEFDELEAWDAPEVPAKLRGGQFHPATVLELVERPHIAFDAASGSDWTAFTTFAREGEALRLVESAVASELQPSWPALRADAEH